MEKTGPDPIRILIVEHDVGDIELLQYQLKKNGFNYITAIVQTKEDLLATLVSFRPDIVLADYNLPAFDGPAAFSICKAILPDVPFIIVSGTIGEENAVELIRSGVTDYSLKDKLFTIVPKIRRALKEAREAIEKKEQDQKLRISMERYHTLSRATNDVIWDWDINTGELYWNEGIKTVFGYQDNQVKKEIRWRYDKLHPDDQDRVMKKIGLFSDNGINHWQDEYRYRCADNSYKYVFDRGFILRNENGQPYRMIGAMMDLTVKKELENLLNQERIEYQRKLAYATMEGQEIERNEIGKELHDNINQLLGVTKMYLSMAVNGHVAKNDLLQRCFNNVEKSIHEIRRISKSMVPPILNDFGLVESIQSLVEEIELARPFAIEFLYGNDCTDFGSREELALYRIIQEQLNNIIKHAQASQVLIELSRQNNMVFLTITDDGKGFNPQAKRQGVGLNNILSRVELLYGKAEIISGDGIGCTLKVQLPVQADRQQHSTGKKQNDVLA